MDEINFDFVNYDNKGVANEFILKAGYIWEYKNDNYNKIKLINNGNNNVMIHTNINPEITDEIPFIFVNPSCKKICKYPAIVMNYKYLINEILWPESMLIKTNSFYNFQISSLTILPTLLNTTNNKYYIQCVIIPSITHNSLFNYIEGIGL